MCWEKDTLHPLQHLPPLVHECHGALRLVTKNPREKLQRQAHVYGHKDVGGVDHHCDGGEEEGVEYGLLPGLQHIDAGDEQVLVVEPGQVLPEAFEVHLLPWTKAGGGGTTGAWGGGGGGGGLIKTHSLDELKNYVCNNFSLFTVLYKHVLYDTAKSWCIYNAFHVHIRQLIPSLSV